MQKELYVKIEARAEIILLRPLDLFVRNLVEQLPGFSNAEEVVDNVELAFNEAFANICRHAYKSSPKGPVQVEIFVRQHDLEIRLEDNGESFNPDEIAEPDLQNLGESGLGIWFMKKFMDEWIYKSDETGKNTLRLIKNMPCKSATV